MGISLAEAHVLFSLKRRGALGDEFLSLGRPEVYISKRELQGLVSAYDLSWSENDISRATSAAYAEPLLQLLGFRTVRSLDISAYQGANIIHDLNWPIPKEFEATTNFLYGNGTIEHVFDVATALKNVVRLLRVGGMVVLAGPANGYCGHGFYQFSPELFYNVLSLNGFDHVRVYIVGRSYPQRWFRAADPKELKRRVEFMTTEPTDIIVIACKVKQVSDFVCPQQSDYNQLSWNMSPKESEEAHSGWARRPPIYSKLLKRASLTSAVALRYLTGRGMPGVPGPPHFDAINPIVDEI
jgi:hypothetical protein